MTGWRHPSSPTRSGRSSREPADADARARAFAVDPRHNVVLEASAGTGKTSVLVSALRQPAEGRRRAGATSSRSRSRARRRPRCASASSASCARRAARSEFDRRAGSRCATASARSRSARSTRSACRCCASSRSRRTSIPGFDMADETEVPRLDRGVARPLAADLRRPGASSDPDIALVLAQLGVSRTRAGPGVAARAAARRVGRARSVPRARAADLTAGDRLPPRRRRRCRTCCGTRARRPGAVPRRRARRAIRATSCSLRELQRLRDARTARRTRRSAALLDRVARALPDAATARRGRAARSIRTTPTHYPRRRTRPSAIATRVFADRAAGRARRAAVHPRPERRPRARRPPDVRDRARAVPAGARRALGPRLLRRARSARSICCARWTSSRRAGSGSSRAITTCWSTSSRTRAARSGSWSRCSIQSWGEGIGLATSPSIFIVGDRKQSIYRFRDAEVAVLQEAGRYIEALRPAATPRRSICAQLPRGARAARVRQRAVRARWRSRRGAPDDFTYDETRSLSRRRRSRRRQRRAVRRSASRRRTIRTRAPPPSRPRSQRILREETRPRPARPACRARPGRATSRSCSARARATASSSTSSSGAAIPDLRLQGARLLRRRRDQGRRPR